MSIFVIHKHKSKKLHYDLRIEVNGVLKSWAVPKEPVKLPGIKRLSVQVDDHDLSYANFEGVIPEGEYGAGKVEIWDKGEVNILSYSEKKIVFELKGRKLDGKWYLVKTNYPPGNKWLLIYSGKEK